MITNTLVIGPAPDFLMKLGSVSIYHAAAISLTGPNVRPRTFSSSHLSFLNLTKEISQRMLAFGWTRDVKMEWEDELIGFSFKAQTGTLVVQYKIHPQLSVKQANLLGHWFQNELKNLLGIQA